MSEVARIAFLGLGAMGAPMAQRLLVDGVDLRVFDPDLERQEAVASAGATATSSAASAADGADLVFVAVVNGDQADAALLGPGGAVEGLAAGSVAVITSTIGPPRIKQLAEKLSERGVSVVDAPVSGGVGRAATGDLVVMAAGEDAAMATAEPYLNRLAAKVFNCGQAVGQGQAVKLVNQLLCGVHIVAAAEALSYASAIGLEPELCFEVTRGGAAASFMLDDRGSRMIRDEFSPPKSALSIFIKDLNLVLDTAADNDFPTPLASTAFQTFLAGSALGFGDEDDSGVSRVLRSLIPDQAL